MTADTGGKLRVLHLTAGSDAGGLSRYIYDLSTAMLRSGHEVEVAGERGAWHWLFTDGPQPRIPWTVLPLKGGPVALARAAGMLRKKLKRRPVDVIHCHYRRPALVTRLLQALGVKGRNGERVPMLYTVHLSPLNLSWGRRWVSDFGDHTHVASHEALDWTLTGARIPAERVSLIPHGVKVDEFPVTTPTDRATARRLLDLGPDDRVAVYVGRLDQRHPKNCPWLLDLAAAWRAGEPSGNPRPPLRILLAGEGPDAPELQARIDREGLSDTVRLLGHRAPLPVYQAADLMLLPSGREGFSLVTTEAMSTGLPVLRTRTAGTADLIVEGHTGSAVPIDRDAFLRRALELLTDEPALTAMRPEAARHVRDHFTFDRQLDSTLALYRRLCQAQG